MDTSKESLFDNLFSEEALSSSTKLDEPLFKYTTFPRSDGEKEVKIRLVAKHALWGDHLWNAGRWLATYFDKHPEETVRGRRIVELGAGAGLPSLIALANGASQVVITDYPDQELVTNLAFNVAQNFGHEPELMERARCVGYLWGGSVDVLCSDGGNLEEKNNQHSMEHAMSESKLFDVVILCDLVFNHSEHAKLLRSCQNLVKPDGMVWCVFTHYRPWLADRDLQFLTMAATGGLRESESLTPEKKAARLFKVEKFGEHQYDNVMFEADRGDPTIRKTVHIYKLVPNWSAAN